MFYKDDHGIETCQLGTGDVMVSLIHFPDTKECAGVSFSSKEKEKIGVNHPELNGTKDYENNTKMIILFTKTESIDVVIEKLQKAKKFMDS